MFLSRLLAGVVGFSRRNALIAFIAGLALMAACAVYAYERLGVSTDTDLLFSSSLPWRQREIAFAKLFPQFSNLLVVVIDAKQPEEADQTAADLAAMLEPDHAHFRSVTRPDASPYFDRNAFMLLSARQLEPLLNQTIDAQPFLGQLVADPSARGLFSALALMAVGVEHGQADLKPYAAALGAFQQALAAAAAGHPQPLSWEKLLGGQLVDLAGKYRFVLVQPVLNYGALAPGGAATDVIRAQAAKLEFVHNGDARVRITGQVALSDEEFSSVAQGALVETLGSAALILLWLILAVRSWRLILPIMLTLCLGLFLTFGFATAAVGTLNLISVAFAILFVGIAVDFAIQFSVRFREARLAEADVAAALQATAHRVGPQILVASGATAAGFLAFVPTAFSGVAELGEIAGAGMLIAFLCTVLFLPAALTLFRPRAEKGEIGFAVLAPVENALVRGRWPVLALFAVLALAGAVLVPRLSFDSDPLHTKNPHTESMETLQDLINTPLSNPYTSDLLRPDVAEADATAARMRQLSLVEDVLTISSFVPTDQKEKLALIADAASILGPTLAARAPAAPVTPDELRMAAHTTAAQIDNAGAALPPGSPLALIGGDLRKLADAPDATLVATDTALTRFLPMQLDRLRLALDAGPVTLADVPESIRRDWVLPDGRARVQVLSKPAARDSAGLHRFVAEVQSIAPDAGGSAVSIVQTAATIIDAFRSAAIGALVAIAAILFLVLRRPLDVALVMAPLLLSALMTALVAVLLPMPLNFANIIALPLLLGVGVSFNIYFVMNWRAGVDSFLGTATARAIVFSAMTTGTAFGSLALSQHPGTASMGKLLLLSLGCTLVATLVFVPTLLRTIRKA